MKCFLNHLTAALTVALLSTSPVVYSDVHSHAAVVDAYDDAYGDTPGQGLIVSTDDTGVTTIRLLNVATNPVKLCEIFGNYSNHIIVVDESLEEMHYDCSL